MANCINCGVKLNIFNETYPLWSNTDEQLCSKCKDKVGKFLRSFDINFHDDAITPELFCENQEYLKRLNISDAGLQYLYDYVESLSISRLENEKRQIDKEKRQLEIEKEIEEKQNQKELAMLEWDINHRSFMATTGYSFEGYRIVEYKGIKSGEIVLGTGFFSELSAAFNDLIGVESISMSNKLTSAKEAALNKLQENCLSVNANAVIGVDLDFNIMGQNIIVASANGTAVRIERIQG